MLVIYIDKKEYIQSKMFKLSQRVVNLNKKLVKQQKIANLKPLSYHTFLPKLSIKSNPNIKQQKRFFVSKHNTNGLHLKRNFSTGTEVIINNKPITNPIAKFLIGTHIAFFSFFGVAIIFFGCVCIIGSIFSLPLIFGYTITYILLSNGIAVYSYKKDNKED